MLLKVNSVKNYAYETETKRGVKLKNQDKNITKLE